MNGRKLYPFLFSAPCLACVAGVRKGRGRELGRETHTLSCAPKFPLPGHAGYPPGGYFRNFWVGMCLWKPETLNLYQS